MDISHFTDIIDSLKSVSGKLVEQLPTDRISDSIKSMQHLGKLWPPLRIGNHTARIPIVQGGMGVGISLSSLASAVANAGGIGVIAANGIGLLEKDYYQEGRNAGLRALRKEIRKARELTKGIIGVNIMVALNDFHQMLDVAIEEKVDVIFMGAGLPIKGIPIRKLRENNVAVAPIVSSARAAGLIFRMWDKLYKDIPDAVVIEGPMAGGHLGFSADQIEKKEFQLENIIPQVRDSLVPFSHTYGREIPIVAGGGVFTGKDIHTILSLGASGVQMATRFVATDECDADIHFKKAYVNCTKDQIGLIKSPVGMPGRAIRNKFIENSEQGRHPAFRCAWKCLANCKAQEANYCISIALNNARKGMIDSGYVFAGAKAYLIDKIVPVADLFQELGNGYWIATHKKATQRLAQLVSSTRNLWEKYEELENKSRTAGQIYAQSLANLPNHSLSEARKQYKSALAKANSLQLQLIEKVMCAWKLVNEVPGPSETLPIKA
ncbi:MAG: nitronate monooxygenase [Spirochaetia bacterium]|nr:nitronate monooxygenase [Spirochaetia bacterium]